MREAGLSKTREKDRAYGTDSTFSSEGILKITKHCASQMRPAYRLVPGCCFASSRFSGLSLQRKLCYAGYVSQAMYLQAAGPCWALRTAAPLKESAFFQGRSCCLFWSQTTSFPAALCLISALL